MDLPRHVTLSDGSRAEIRAWRPEDADELKRGFVRLSVASRQARFLVAKAELSESDWATLLAVDGENHVVVVATTDSPDLKTERGLGIGRLIRLPPGDVAEVAVTVADDAQQKGVGRALLGVLAGLAREGGIRAIRAEVLATNEPIKHLLATIGAVAIEDNDGTLVFEVTLQDPLPDASEAGREHPLRRLLRAAAEALAALRAG